MVAGLDMLVCDGCGRLDMPGTTVCAQCLGSSFSSRGVDGFGRLVSWTSIRRAPTRFRDEAPYEVCVVDLAAGPRVTGRLREGSEAAVGAEVVAQQVREGIPIFQLTNKDNGNG